MSLKDAWEEEAENWIRWATTSGHDSYWRFHRDQFLEMVPAPGTLTVDIGCGEGRLPRHLKALGHKVIGIDGAPSLIEAARKADPDGDYRHADATALPLDDDCADLAVAFMSLHDIDDLTAAIAEVGRILKIDGVFCVAIVHPINSAGRFIDGAENSPFVIADKYLGEFSYADECSRGGLRVVFNSRHRPLDTYSRALEAGGFVIEAIREHPVPDHAIAPGNSAKWQRIPLFLHLRARKRH